MPAARLRREMILISSKALWLSQSLQERAPFHAFGFRSTEHHSSECSAENRRARRFAKQSVSSSCGNTIRPARFSTVRQVADGWICGMRPDNRSVDRPIPGPVRYVRCCRGCDGRQPAHGDSVRQRRSENHDRRSAAKWLQLRCTD